MARVLPSRNDVRVVNVAINGLGRIGRATLKIVMDTPALNLVAVNDLADAEALAYLLKHDTVYGGYDRPVDANGNKIIVGGHHVRCCEKNHPTGSHGSR